MRHLKLSILISAIFFINVPSTWGQDTGIWYSTWYSKQLNYDWIKGHGINSDRQFLADVDGDGDDDAIAFYATTGRWYVAKSDGQGSFLTATLWREGHGVGSTNQIMGDVNGDGRADAIVYFAQNGSWYVATARSSGTSFNGFQRWDRGFHTLATENQLLADINGDGFDDAVTFNDGEWRVALATDVGFRRFHVWAANFGAGSTDQFVGDVDGDGDADAIAFFKSGGEWHVAKSDSKRYLIDDGRWISGHGSMSERRMVGDIDNDGDVDIVAYEGDGIWSSSESDGFDFGPMLPRWKQEHGNDRTISNPRPPVEWLGLGDVYGNGSDGAIVYRGSDGQGDGGWWQVLPGNYHSKSPPAPFDENYFFKPIVVDTWQAYNSTYVPVVNGIEKQYDTLDDGVIESHLELIADAQIDFLLMDQTNSLYNDRKSIVRRGIETCLTIKSTGSPLKYAIAIGSVHEPNDIMKIETEAEDVYKLFIENRSDLHEDLPRCNNSDDYYHVEGKPLLVVYAQPDRRTLWESISSALKPYANMFTIKWVQGTVCDTPTNQPQLRNGNVYCNYPVDNGLVGEYFGWVYVDGAISSTETMVVMPGHNNHGGSINSPVPRDNANFYINKNWQKVICNQPRQPDIVIINSFNEFLEETAIEPANTDNVVDNKWQYPFQYWDITKDYNLMYKAGDTSICE